MNVNDDMISVCIYCLLKILNQNELINIEYFRISMYSEAHSAHKFIRDIRLVVKHSVRSASICYKCINMTDVRAQLTCASFMNLIEGCKRKTSAYFQ